MVTWMDVIEHGCAQFGDFLKHFSTGRQKTEHLGTTDSKVQMDNLNYQAHSLKNLVFCTILQKINMSNTITTTIFHLVEMHGHRKGFTGIKSTIFI